MLSLHPLEQISFTQSNQAYVIEASAGTGKTWTIERLFIKALLEGINPFNQETAIALENILVVTFTNDATNELKERIQEQIQETISHIIYLPLVCRALGTGLFGIVCLKEAIRGSDLGVVSSLVSQAFTELYD